MLGVSFYVIMYKLKNLERNNIFTSVNLGGFQYSVIIKIGSRAKTFENH